MDAIITIAQTGYTTFDFYTLIVALSVYTGTVSVVRAGKVVVLGRYSDCEHWLVFFLGLSFMELH